MERGFLLNKTIVNERLGDALVFASHNYN